ncbi:AEC family transporter [Deinococcus peraridilitoris]|uniref:Putative permease n=1 Tax=Deinococcus peraridilitoris (strain DSM 19664 / LMG 22246 / CIP 109416 / KR-200) TaxID=937777 RepID=L0A3Q3_DEIPD|nr:AEC family transporter [Deinococcus peraridilitoris]AFZ68528.1 putative permease [Deinococcus peraridilitoris DSM 19664]
MLSALLNVVMPAVVVAAVGLIVARQMQIDRQALSKLVLYAMTPALVLDTLLHTTVNLTDASQLIVGYLAGVAVMGVLAALCAARFEARTRRSVVAAVVTGNNGNFGLPIALFAFGETGLQFGLIIFITSVMMTFTLGPALYGSSAGLRQGLRAVTRLPILWCALFALLMRILHLELPLGLDRGVHLLAQATLPIMLLALGLQFGASGWPKITRPVVTATGLRLLAGPVVAFGVALLLGLHSAQLQALVLASSMPTAVNAFMLAGEFGADVESVANTVALTTLGSLLTIAAVVTALPLIPAP